MYLGLLRYRRTQYAAAGNRTVAVIRGTSCKRQIETMYALVQQINKVNIVLELIVSPNSAHRQRQLTPVSLESLLPFLTVATFVGIMCVFMMTGASEKLVLWEIEFGLPLCQGLRFLAWILPKTFWLNTWW